MVSWSAGEVAILLANADKGILALMRLFPTRSKVGIRSAARRYGTKIGKSGCVKWTRPEITVVRREAMNGISSIQRFLPARSRSSIKAKIKHLRIPFLREESKRGAEHWRGKLVVPPKIHPLVGKLITEMNRQLVLPGELCRRAGVGRMTFGSWRENEHLPKLDCLIACFQALGRDLIVGVLKDGV